MLACPFGSDWNKLVSAVGKFQAYKDYIQFNGDIRTPEQVMSKLAREGFNMSTLPGYQYQVERTYEKLPKISEPALTTMGEFFKMKFPGYTYRVENNPNAKYKGYVEPSDPNVPGSKPMIVLNSAKATLDTPIHEFGHIFVHMLRRENIRAYFSVMNSIFDSKVERVETTDAVTGKKKVERKIVGYEPKAEYKAEFDLLKDLYPNLSEEELAEEFLVEMLGRYASEYFDPQTGRPIAEIRSSTIGQKLAKALAKVWEAIREMLLGTNVTVKISDISPITSIDALASILADPNINLQFGSKLTKLDSWRERVLREKLVGLEEFVQKMDQGTNYDMFEYMGDFFVLNPGTKARIDHIKNTWNKITDYVNNPTGISTTATFRNGLVMLNRILSSEEMRNKPIEEKRAILDRPDMHRVKFFLSMQSDIDMALRALSSTEDVVKRYMDRYANEAYTLIYDANYSPSRRPPTAEQFIKDVLRSSSATAVANRLFKIDPHVYKFDAYNQGIYSPTLQDIRNKVEKDIKEAKETLTTGYVKNNYQSDSFTTKAIRPTTGEVVEDLINVSGSYNEDTGDISVSFSSDMFSYSDAYFVVPGSISTVKPGRKVHVRKADETPLTFTVGEYENEEASLRYSFFDKGVVKVEGTNAILLQEYEYKEWDRLLERGDTQEAERYFERNKKVVPVDQLYVQVDQEGRGLDVMNKVVDTIAANFANVPYKSISFTPAGGSSLTKASGELRQKLYIATAQRMFGRYATVIDTRASAGSSFNGATIILPSWYSTGVNITTPLYQMDSSTSLSEKAEDVPLTEDMNTSLQVSIEQDTKNIMVQPQNQDNAGAVGMLTNIVSMLANKIFGRALAGQMKVGTTPMNYQFISEQQALEITAGTRNQWSGQKAFFIGDTVYFVGENLTLKDMFHEFSHPFVRSLMFENRKLFNKIYNDILATKEGQILFENVKAAYPELDEADPMFAEEMIVKTLEASFRLSEAGIEQSKGFLGAVKNLLYAIKQLLRSTFGKNINISKLSADTTIQQLGDMLKAGQGVQISEQALQEVDTVAYTKEMRDYLKDLNKVSKPELAALTVKFHDIALKQIDTVMRNKNYKEMLNILADEFKRGDLQEIRSNLSKFARPLEDKLAQRQNEIERSKAHTTAMVNSLFRLNNMVEKIKTHMKEIAKQPDDIDNMHKAYYYDYLLRYWDKYIEEMVKTLDAADVPTNSPLSVLVAGIKRTIDSTQTDTRKMYKKGAGEVIWGELRMMGEKLDEKYSKIISDLKAKKASQKLIDVYMKEYYGLNQAELDRKNELEAKYKAGTITTANKRELDSLRVKAMDGAQITEEKIEMALNGELRDANVFNSFFEGYLYNTDPVVGGFALYVKNQMSDVLNRSMGKFNDYVNDMRPLLEAAGYTPSDVNALIEKIAKKELIGRRNDKGEWEESQVWTLKSAHTGWRIALDRLRDKIDQAQREFSEHNTTAAHQNLVDAIAEKKKLLRDYFYQEYDQKVYARDKMLGPGYRLNKDGVDVGIEAAYRRDKILDQIKEITESTTGELDEFLMMDQIENLWREYYGLYSLVDKNGKLKEGLDCDVAMLLKEYREANVDPDTGESFYEEKLRPGVFENALAKYLQQVAEKHGYGTPKYLEMMDAWIRKNTRVKVSPKFYEDRKQILDAIDAIMSKLPDAQRKKLNTSDMWTKILDITAGNRDNDGQPNGMNFTEKGIAFVKEQQEAIMKAQEEFSNLSGLTKSEAVELQGYWDVINAKERKLTDDEQIRFDALMDKSDRTGLSKLDKQKLFALFAKLAGLQKKDATDYYVGIINSHLQKLDTTLMMQKMNTNNITKETANLLLDDVLLDNLMFQSPEFAEWFKANHIRKEVFDKATKAPKQVWERLYVWNVVRPIEEEYYEKYTIKFPDGSTQTVNAVPAMKYHSRVVKKQYRTERIVGRTVDNQGNFLPRMDVADSPFIDRDYLNMQSTDPKHYAILEKMKEHHLRNQEGLGYKARLYLDVPRYRKNNLEVLRTKSLANLAGGVGERNFPMLNLIIERVRNFFRKAKDEKSGEYNWEDDAILCRADMFDNEAVSVPITGLYDIDIDDVSPDVNQALMRYMFSAERHKKLVEINPVAQALKATVNDPDNLAKQLDRINKFNFVHRGIITYLSKKGRYTRQAAVNNFIEREFEGKGDAGWTQDMPIIQNVSNLILKRASMSFFALNIPSAVKNAISAKWQAMIHSIGGVDIDPMSMAKGEGWATMTMGQLSMGLYGRANKPLNLQIADSFDAIRERAESKLPESLSRTIAHDVASLSWLTNFRKWTEDQAGMQLFAGAMYKKIIKQNGKDITYMDAWELVDNKLKLKDGIDVRYSNLPTEYTVQEGDTIESLAKKFYMTEEDLKKELGKTQLKAGKEITIDNKLYKQFKNRFQSMQVDLNGAYSKFDQPEAQRYLLFRFISFLKRFFTPMLMRRWGFSGSFLGRKRGRINYGASDIQEGYYVTFLKTASRLVEFSGENWAHMTKEEKLACAKVIVEVVGAVLLVHMAMAMSGFDPEDEDRWEKLREKSGAAPFLGLVPEDSDHPFKMSGWLQNHAFLMALQVRAENEAFIPFPGFGIDNYYETLTDASSVGFGPTLRAYTDMIELAYMEATGNPKARYSKDSGPYKWQREGGSKLWTTFWKSIGLTGGTLDPITAAKNNPQLITYQGKKK